jgi:hypothetical protein
MLAERVPTQTLDISGSKSPILEANNGNENAI